jgi:hypothetical protein
MSVHVYYMYVHVYYMCLYMCNTQRGFSCDPARGLLEAYVFAWALMQQHPVWAVLGSRV